MACGGDAFEGNARAVDDASADAALDAEYAGSGGTSGSVAAGGVAGRAGAAGAAGLGVGGVAGVAGVAGTAGTPAQDAGSDACIGVTLYLDGDGDGYGGTTTSVGCEGATGWVSQGGDCDDSNPDVHPGQSAYFVQGYVKTGGGEISFDYDCSGSESEAGTNPKASCHVMSLQCVGGGYVPATPLRSGPGVDAYCGSDEKLNCVGNSLKCDPGATYAAEIIACR